MACFLQRESLEINEHMKKNAINMRVHIIVIWIITILMYLICRFSINMSTPTQETVKKMCILTVTIYLISFWVWYCYTRKIASLFFVFLLFCFLFNAGQIVVGIFDTSFVDIVNIFKDYSAKYLVKMMIIQSDCVLAMVSGALLAYNKKTYEIVIVNPRNVTNNGKNLLSSVYVILSLFLVFVYLREVLVRGVASYGDYYYGEREGISVLLLFLYHVVMYVLVMTNENNTISKLVIITNIIISLLMLMVGSRNAVCQIVFGVFFIISYINNKKIELSFGKTIKLAIISLFLMIFFTGVQDLRQYSLSELNVQVFVEVFSTGFLDSIVSSLTQMGGSARCIIQTIIQLDLGAETESTFMYSVWKSFVPMGIVDMLGVHRPINYSLSAWITNVGGSTSGWGYSIFAEAYYNFRELGFVFFLFWGFIYVKAEQWALKLVCKGRLFESASVIYILSYAVFLARADSILITTRMRFGLYVFIIFYFIRSYKTENKYKWR